MPRVLRLAKNTHCITANVASRGPFRAPTWMTDYHIIVGPQTLPHACEGFTDQSSKVLIVSDHNLPGSAHDLLANALQKQNITFNSIIIQPTELVKSLATVERICTLAANMNLERGDLIVGLGGGIITDLSGFAAAIYRRGVRVIQCPTTLLAMVDASVGGKAAANISTTTGLLKNMIGAFWQPSRVVCDVTTLKFLDDRTFASGMAECFKHAIIAGQSPLSLPYSSPPHARSTQPLALKKILNRESAALTTLIAANVALKARIVQSDPREEASSKTAPGRMALNLGHTFAHAIETLPNLSWKNAQGKRVQGPLTHGEAVGLGLLAAATLADDVLGVCNEGLSSEVHAALSKVGLPTRISGLPDQDTILQRMHADKKVTRGKLKLILPIKPAKSARSQGIAVLATDDVPEDAILQAMTVWTRPEF